MLKIKKRPLYQEPAILAGLFIVSLVGSAGVLNAIDPKSEGTTRNVQVSTSESRKDDDTKSDDKSPSEQTGEQHATDDTGPAGTGQQAPYSATHTHTAATQPSSDANESQSYSSPTPTQANESPQSTEQPSENQEQDDCNCLVNDVVPVLPSILPAL